jgi:hypothetical protein
MAVTPEREIEGVRFLDDEESHEYFDRQARRLMNMSGEEFLRRYDAGEFETEMDGSRHRQLVKMVALLPFAR